VEVYKNGEYSSSEPLLYDAEENLFYTFEYFTSGEYEINVYGQGGYLIHSEQISFGEDDEDSLSLIGIGLDPETFEVEITDDLLPEEINNNNFVKMIVTRDGSVVADEYLPCSEDDVNIFEKVLNGLTAGRYVVSVLEYDEVYGDYVISVSKTVDVANGNALLVSYNYMTEQVSLSEISATDITPDNSQNNGGNQGSTDNTNNTNNTGNTNSADTTGNAGNTNAASNTASPKTGDSVNPWLYIMMLMASGSLAAVVYGRKRVNK
jgi:LPXTG-motif cell wall-anchored protein